MADENNRDSFDEFLDRAEEDLENEGYDYDEADDEADDEEELDGIGGSSLSGTAVSDEMKAQSLMV